MNLRKDRNSTNWSARRKAFVLGGAVAGVALNASRGTPLDLTTVLVATALMGVTGAMLGSWAFELGEKRTRGTLIGAIMGMILGPILLPLFDESRDPSFARIIINAVEGALLGATIGTAPRGALIGAGVGASISIPLMVVFVAVGSTKGYEYNLGILGAAGVITGLIIGALGGALISLSKQGKTTIPRL